LKRNAAMPKLIPNKKFISDLEKFKHQKALLKKIAETINFLEANPRHLGLRIERIVNDPTAWSARVDKRYRISFAPESFLATGSPDWTSKLKLLRILDHDSLYKTTR
jgi:Txe/YoeB family toxin of Txe-Axe toxin-antitoxin module